MITSKLLKDVVTEARPIIERQLDDAEIIAGLRDVVADNGGDWSSLKALIKAQIEDERDECGNGKRVRKILDKADNSCAYADILGLAKMNEKNFSAEASYDPETGEILEDEIPKPATEAAAVPSEDDTKGQKVPAELAHRAGHAGRGDGTASAPMHANVSEGVTGGESAATSRFDDFEIPAWLLRSKPPREAVTDA